MDIYYRNIPCVVNLVNSIVGVSILAMPFCLHQVSCCLRACLLACVRVSLIADEAERGVSNADTMTNRWHNTVDVAIAQLENFNISRLLFNIGFPQKSPFFTSARGFSVVFAGSFAISLVET